MEKIEAIKNRHSVRKYLDKELEPVKVARLSAEIEEINRESGLNFQLVTNEKACFGGIMSYGKFENVANYIALVGKKSKDLDEKIGYYGERLVILAQELGLNTCWVGLTYNKGKAQVKVGAGEKLVCVIALGYGENQGVAHKNKPVEKVSNQTQDSPEWFKNGVECALLAPTAINQQKFYLENVDGKVKISAGMGFYSKVDLGIIKYHFEIGAGKDNFEWA